MTRPERDRRSETPGRSRAPDRPGRDAAARSAARGSLRACGWRRKATTRIVNQANGPGTPGAHAYRRGEVRLKPGASESFAHFEGCGPLRPVGALTAAGIA
jgi:hypothetical protein